MKYLYLDTETTGTDPKKHDIIQLAGYIVIDGKLKEEFNLKCQPKDYTTIEEEALKINKNTVDDLRKLQKPEDMLKEFISILAKYVDKYDKTDKYTPVGYNVRFDLDFLQEFFKKNGEAYGTGSWQNWRVIDPLFLVYYMAGKKEIELENYKLETVCKHFGIELEAHDAMADIKATRALLKTLKNLLIVNK